MKDKLASIVGFLTEVERLKLVPRRAYVSDLSRRENSAEHSWHLAVGLLVLSHELDIQIDLQKALSMALVHDLCEIDAGDTPAYGVPRPDQQEVESRCIQRLAGYGTVFGFKAQELWLEYEAQQTVESRWVKALDRLLPFVVNLATKGHNWKAQSIARSQVLKVSAPVKQMAPEIHEWMKRRIDQCVADGWLRDD